jgi:glycosyltransferase involved in cell wall biosynthesis
VPEDEIQYERLREVCSIFNLPRKYILFVGVLHPRKNIPFLLHSYAKLKRETCLPHKLVLAGLRGSAAEGIEDLIRALDITSDVIITGYVQDWQLPLIYKYADLFVLPSIYEGFALVNLEAMHYGVPVISTECSAIGEIVGDAATLVTCNNIDQLTRAMHELLTDDVLRQQRICKGKERVKMFSWDRCARETLSLYCQMYHQSLH